jgi:hypothetical protein
METNYLDLYTNNVSSMNEDLWSLLHDGRLIAFNGSSPGDVTLSVEIPYLCRYLPTTADTLNLTLTGCSQLEYQPFEASRVWELSAIAELCLEVLSAKIRDNTMCVYCSDGGYGGTLFIQYYSARVKTAEGRLLSSTELLSASDRYWTDWRTKHK